MRQLPVCHLLPVPAEGVVSWCWFTTAQCLPEPTVEGVEALQVGYKLPEKKNGEIKGSAGRQSTKLSKRKKGNFCEI